MNKDTISYLILKELKLIRKEMKEEIRKLCESIQFFHYDKTSENALNSNQVFIENLENKERFANNLNNHNNDVIVKDEHVPGLTEGLTKCESNFCAEQNEVLSSENLKSDNFEVGPQLSEIELGAESKNDKIIKEIIEEENILCKTAEHKILPSKLAIVDVKSLRESKNRSDELNFDVSSLLFQRSEEIGKVLNLTNSKLNDFTCSENDSEILLEPIDYTKLDKNNITHQIPSEKMITCNENDSEILLEPIDSTSFDENNIIHQSPSKNVINFSYKPIVCKQSIPKSIDYFPNIKAHTNNETHSGIDNILHNYSESILSNTKRNSLPDVNHFDRRRKNVCQFCNKTFSTNYKLKVHMRIHDRENLHKCNICNKGFSSRPNLVIHIRSHTGERPHKCSICKKGFKQRNYLVDHARIHTGERPYKCSICEKGFIRKTYLVDHARIHTGERPYKCSICKKGFKQRYHLKKHVRIHTGERPYKCSICEKGFIQKYELDNHVRIHTGERPHKCSICEKGFKQRNHLRRHARIHTGEKPHKCSICNKDFLQKSHLVRHTRIHTAEKSFKCNICDKNFRDNSVLVQHIRIHTGEKPYKCNICNKCFSRNSSLTRHARIHTNQTI